MNKNNFFLLLSFILISFSCFSQEMDTKGGDGYFSVGEDVEVVNVLSSYQMQERYENLKPGDTLSVTFKAGVASVCKNKGCWMKVALADGSEVMVKFKDYGFFVPKDIEQSEVIMEGKAYVTEMSIEDRRHYAEDAGKSASEVLSITEPVISLSFLAKGVKIKE